MTQISDGHMLYYTWQNLGINIHLQLYIRYTFSGDVIEITTPKSYDYLYLEDYGLYYAAEGYVVFLVKARNDVHLTLSTRKGDWLNDSYEIVIGGWYNTRSAIRACHQCKPSVQTNHNPLDENFFLPFWVSWSANEIRVGQGTGLSSKEFLHWEDPGPLSVNYIGISTGWGAEGNWIFGIGKIPVAPFTNMV